MLFVFSRPLGGFLDFGRVLVDFGSHWSIGRPLRRQRAYFHKKTNMRSIVLTAGFFVLGLCQLKAQGKEVSPLAGTSWKGTSYVPDPLTCLMKFSKDTLRIFYADDPEININDGQGGMRTASGKDSAILETMTYRLSGDTLELRKVSGGSPCGEEKGQYHAQAAGGKLKFILIQDPCAVRPYALRDEFALVK